MSMRHTDNFEGLCTVRGATLTRLRDQRKMEASKLNRICRFTFDIHVVNSTFFRYVLRYKERPISYQFFLMTDCVRD